MQGDQVAVGRAQVVRYGPIQNTSIQNPKPKPEFFEPFQYTNGNPSKTHSAASPAHQTNKPIQDKSSPTSLDVAK